MGQLIKFPDRVLERAGYKNPLTKSGLPCDMKPGAKSAEVLFFTGVRYERYAEHRTSLPSERLISTSVKH
jgi:hypothetical protein